MFTFGSFYQNRRKNMDRYGIKDKKEKILGFMEIERVNKRILKISKIILENEEKTLKNGEEIRNFLADEYSGVKYFLVEKKNFWIGGALVSMSVHDNEMKALIKK